MSHRIFNVSAGPAMLPTEALEKSAAALLDFQGKGFGIAEVGPGAVTLAPSAGIEMTIKPGSYAWPADVWEKVSS